MASPLTLREFPNRPPQARPTRAANQVVPLEEVRLASLPRAPGSSRMIWPTSILCQFPPPNKDPRLVEGRRLGWSDEQIDQKIDETEQERLEWCAVGWQRYRDHQQVRDRHGKRPGCPWSGPSGCSSAAGVSSGADCCANKAGTA